MNIGCCWKVSDTVKYEVFGSAGLEEGRLIFCDNSDVVFTASVGSVYCKSVFRTLSSKDFEALHKKQNEEHSHIQERIEFLISCFQSKTGNA